MKSYSIDWNYFFVIFLASLFFLPFLGGVHLFDWDEINFAECSREMILKRTYLRPSINFEPFWEKPPLFFWLQSASMHLFGINEYAARFPNAICGILTLVLIYHLGKNLYDKNFGWYWVLAYFGSLLPHLYFKSGIIDPFFNLFIFLGLIFLIKSEKKNDSLYINLLLGGLFAGLSILTKGPVSMLIIGLTWFIKQLIYKELSFKKIINFSIFSLTALTITSLWFGIETLKHGTWFVKTFIEYNIRLAKTEDAGHGGFMGYHFVVLLVGCFPASIFALRTLYKRSNFEGEQTDFTNWMKILFWVVLILFSMVQSKIVHYSSLCYLPLTFLSAITLKTIIDEKQVFKGLKMGILSIGLFIGLLITALPFIGQNIILIKPLFQKDVFALKNLEALVTWHYWESVVGLFFIGGIGSANLLFKKYKIQNGILTLFVTSALFVHLVLIIFINKIEGYSQNAAIEFYKSKITEDCYIETFHFKSYAHLFYSQKRIPTHAKHADNQWLMNENIDKPTYFVAKYNSKSTLDTIPTLQYLYDKNGFVFYKRK